MTALTANRDTPRRDGVDFVYPMAAATEIFEGSLVVLDASGNAEPATDATGKIAVGRAEEYKNNAGAAAADTIRVRAGIFRWVNSGTNTPTKANIGDVLYIVDDQTVDTLGTGSSPAGTMVDIDALGSWVKTEPPVSAAAGLLAANNLSDVGTVATARANLGLDTGDSVTFDDVTVAGLLTVAETATKVIGTVGLDFNTCRVHDNLAALLPVAGATDDLGNVPGTVGTTAPSLQTEDLKAAGATDNKATFFLTVPDWYTAGSTLNLVCNAGMITTVADTTATLDVEAWVPDYANADGTVSTDLCGTAATSINSTTFADKSFVIDDDLAGHVLEAGSVIQFRITTAVNDAATGTAVIAAIRKIHLAVTA